MPHTASIRRLRVGSDWIEYDDSGDGEPILLVHAGVFSDWFAPVAAEAALSEFRLIRVRRAGYVAGMTPTGHLTIADHARHCAMLLDEMGVSAAHVCGHSSSALIGLQLAIDRPELVHSLVLLDPAPGGDLLGPINAPVIPNVVGPAMAAYGSGDVATGFERFMNAVCGSHHRSVMERVLGTEGYDRAVRESAFFPDEVAAVGEWRFGAADAERIGVPTVLVDGERTAEVATVRPESVTRLGAMMPHAKLVVLPGVSHLMPLEDPSGVARLIAHFVSVHPMAGP